MLLIRQKTLATAVQAARASSFRPPRDPRSLTRKGPKMPPVTGDTLIEEANRRRGSKVPDRRSTFLKGDRRPRNDDQYDRFALTPMPPMDLEPQMEPQRRKLTIPYPKDIVAYLNNFVVGQEIAKRTLAVGVYQHYKRVEYNQKIEENAMMRDAIVESIRRERETLIKQARNRGKRIDIDKDELSSYLNHFRLAKELGAFDTTQLSEKSRMLEKSNIVLLGPSGSGKTYLTLKLADALDVPIAMCDCTTLTQAGYVGDDVESVIQKLVAHAEGDVQRAEQGIVFLDEFDKIYTSSDPQHTAGNRDVSGKGVQQALLKLVEGTRVIIKHPLQPNIKLEVDTSNILFVASGAFSNLERIIARRLEKRVLGFGGRGSLLSEDLNDASEEKVAEAKSHLLKECDHGDLILFGMVPELVGRFPVLVPFHALTESMLREILTEPKNNIVDQARRLFGLDHIDLQFTDCALSEMARLAVQRKTGARALRSIMERVLLEAKYECPGSTRGTVTINGAVVRGEAQYAITEKNKDAGRE